MNKRKIHKELEYFSPTSFMQADSCEEEFYLNRMAGLDIIPFQQTVPMAIGSAFDAFVKAEIARLLGKEVKLADLLENVDEANIGCIKPAHQIFDQYIENDCLNRLMDEGVEDIELVIKKEIGGKQIPGSAVEIGGIPLFGKPDAELKGGVPLDWKVNGYGSKTGQSPKPGYVRCIINGMDKGEHKKYGLPLEEIDLKWAIQLVFYNWMNGKRGNKAAIEQVAIRGETIAFTSYRTYISDYFKQEIWEKLTDFWSRFNEGEFKKAEPIKWKCEPFGNPKPCTLFCSEYKKTLGNELERLMR